MDSDTALFQAKALHRIIATNIKLLDQKRVQSATTALAEVSMLMLQPAHSSVQRADSTCLLRA